MFTHELLPAASDCSFFLQPLISSAPAPACVCWQQLMSAVLCTDCCPLKVAQSRTGFPALLPWQPVYVDIIYKHCTCNITVIGLYIIDRTGTSNPVFQMILSCYKIHKSTNHTKLLFHMVSTTREKNLRTHLVQSCCHQILLRLQKLTCTR